MTDILGAGWAFPVQLDPQGRVALAHGAVDIEQAIKMIVLTRTGERVMRPAFGCEIHELVFEPNDAATADMAAQYVRDALAMWEPRIRVLGVTVEPDVDGWGVLHITIDYEIKASHDRRTLVFPLYAIPGE
jgi:phage baseplate assembly protein W